MNNLMHKITEIIDMILDYLEGRSLIVTFLDTTDSTQLVFDWTQIFKISSVIVIALLFTGLLFVTNDAVFERYMKKRVKTHHLTITNHGNTPSIFLLRTVDLPKSLAVRFRIGEEPMIRVTYVPKKTSAAAGEETADTLSDRTMEYSSEAAAQGNSIVPDLNDPLGNKKKSASGNPKQAVKKVTKTINDVGKKAGFFGSFLSNISSLFSKKIPGVNDAQKTLKNFQQQTTETTTAINTKVNTVGNLKDQVSQMPGADKISGAAKNVGIDSNELLKKKAGDLGFEQNSNADISNLENVLADGDSNMGVLHSANFSYDEETWLKSLGKVDEQGGSLIYGQSKILEPGETMKIGVEIMNLSDHDAAVSHFYKIEVQQIPQTKLNFTAPNRYVNGIVIFKKSSIIHRILPQVIIIGLLIISIQLLALYCYLIF